MLPLGDKDFLFLRKITKITLSFLAMELVTGIISIFTLKSPPNTICRTRGFANTLSYVFSANSISLLLHAILGITLISSSVYLALTSIRFGLIFSILSFMALVSQIGAVAVGLFMVDVYFHNITFSLVMLAAALLSTVLYSLMIFVARNYKRLNL